MSEQNFLPALPLSFKDLRSKTELSKDFKFQHDNVAMKSCVHQLNWINCFIGANNSGKSRAIRAIFNSIESQSQGKVGLVPFQFDGSQFSFILDIVKEKTSQTDENLIKMVEMLTSLTTPSFYSYHQYTTIYDYWKILTAIIDREYLLQPYIEGLIMTMREIPDGFESLRKEIEDNKAAIKGLRNSIEEKTKKKEECIKKLHRIEELKKKIAQYDELVAKHQLLGEIKELSNLTETLKQLDNQIAKIIAEIGSDETSHYTKEQLRKTLKPLEGRREETLKKINHLSSFNIEHLIKEFNSLKILSLPSKEVLENELDILSKQGVELELRRLDAEWVSIQKEIIQLGMNTTGKQTNLEKTLINRFSREIKLLFTTGLELLSKSTIKTPKLYIPILRGTRPLDDLKTDLYANRTQKDYKIPQAETFTGLSLYQELQKHLLGSYDKRRLIKEFEEFLSASFFDGQEVVLIPNIDSDVVHIKIGNKEMAIYDLGDGVQGLIILTFPLFLRKDEEWTIFIEEPEAHLHPRWQRFFVDTIIKYFPKHQFFITSHSNVFLNNKHVSVYRVSQDDRDKKTTMQYIDTQHADLLDELGYKASDVLNANYIVWVEGVSDKIYLKQFIKAYNPELEEGVHYSIMFYGGCTNLVEHVDVSNGMDIDKANILAINPKCGFVIDSDLENASIELARDAKGKKKHNFKLHCEASSNFCWVTKSREMENLIPEDKWRSAAINYAIAINERNHNLIDSVEIDPSRPDMNFNDRRHTSIKLKAGDPIKVNNKPMMAKEVVKLFPLNREDLESVAELNEEIGRLVGEIEKANGMR